MSLPTSAKLALTLTRLKKFCSGSINLLSIADKLTELYIYDLLSSLKVDDQSLRTDPSKYKKLSYARLTDPYAEFTFLMANGASTGEEICYKFDKKNFVGILKLLPSSIIPSEDLLDKLPPKLAIKSIFSVS